MSTQNGTTAEVHRAHPDSGGFLRGLCRRREASYRLVPLTCGCPTGDPASVRCTCYPTSAVGAGP